MVRIHVPNVPQPTERFARSTIAEKWALSGALLGMYCNADTSRPEEIAWPADHQILFDAELLRWSLQNAGFADPVDRTADVIDYHTEDWKHLSRTSR